jgi:hypothetical protein
MGDEALCRVRFNDQLSEGKALLETTELLFRGDFRLKIPFAEITDLDDQGDELHVGFSQGTAVFELGRSAGPWAAKIRNPRGLMQKLGVKPADAVAVIGVQDGYFLEQLRAHTSSVSEGSVAGAADLVFYGADSHDDLAYLQELRGRIKPKGAVWVVSRKGKAATVKDTEVMAAAREAGLVDTKVVSFSDTHTALKLVIPVAKRN